MKEIIKEHNLNRVIVASCSPRLHESTFRRMVEEAGLNKYLFEMANIREHVSWVHTHDPEKATEKAKDLVRMAVAKANLLEQHIDYALKSGDVLTALDKLAIAPFFKFKQRIAKVLYKRYVGGNTATAIVLGSLLAYVDGIESMSGQDFERAEESFFEVLSKTSGSPFTHLGEILTPAFFDNVGFTNAPH